MCNLSDMEKLAKYLQETGVSQRSLAVELGVDASIISKLLSGATRPGLDLAIRIQRLTGGNVPAECWVPSVLPETKGAA